jgi:hypothetical protein
LKAEPALAAAAPKWAYSRLAPPFRDVANQPVGSRPQRESEHSRRSVLGGREWTTNHYEFFRRLRRQMQAAQRRSLDMLCSD